MYRVELTIYCVGTCTAVWIRGVASKTLLHDHFATVPVGYTQFTPNRVLKSTGRIDFPPSSLATNFVAS